MAPSTVDDVERMVDDMFDRAFATWEKNPMAQEILNRPRNPRNFVSPLKASVLIAEAEIGDIFVDAATRTVARDRVGEWKGDLVTLGPTEAPDTGRSWKAQPRAARRQGGGGKQSSMFLTTQVLSRR
jgi:acyl-CoA reductase-like NAD-dependent aldehyde dehydrogenase